MASAHDSESSSPPGHAPSPGAAEPTSAARRVIVEFVTGRRRGKRVEFAPGERIRFGRHPCSEVAFDARRDLVTSSHHAELSWRDDTCRLCDVGSSNGLLVAGTLVTEVTITPDAPVVVEFGSGGPVVRIFWGDSARVPFLPEFSGTYARVGAVYQVIFGVAVAIVVALSLLAWILLV